MTGAAHTLCMSSQNRHPAGSPVGGRYAPSTLAEADPSVTLTDAAESSNIQRVAAQSGWNLLSEVATDLNYQGEVHSDSLQLIDVDRATDLGEDYLAPAIDEAEDFLEGQWRRDGGDQEEDDPDSDEDYRPGPRLDVEGLRARCQAADLPPYVVGFIESVADRENVPTSYLNTLGAHDLGNLEEVISDRVSDMAARLRELDEHATHNAAA